jgi:hypothetical protein
MTFGSCGSAIGTNTRLPLTARLPLMTEPVLCAHFCRPVAASIA